MSENGQRLIRSEPATYASIQEQTSSYDDEEEEIVEEPEQQQPPAKIIPAKFVATQRSSHDGSWPRHQTNHEDKFTRSASAQSLPVGKPQMKDLSDLPPYQRTSYLLANDAQYIKEVSLGKRIGFYRLGKELGSGNFSKVKLEKVAVKIMDKAKMDQKAQKLLAREIQSMEKMNHPNIVKLFECVETLTRVHLVLEYANGGELYAFVHDKGKLSENETKPLFAQIVSAVSHMHSRNLVHRDIKAENVMFSGPGTVKLVDFGFSCFVPRSVLLETFCGSPPYAAPELFRDLNYAGELVDIWALGILLYFMLVGVTPFRGENVAELKAAILQGEFMIPDYVGTIPHNLMKSMLQQDVTKRCDIDDVKKNYWLRDCRFSKSYLSIKTDINEEDTVEEKAAVQTKVWKIMESYGIKQDMLIEENQEKGPRDAIVGTYRIVQYQVQAEFGKKDEKDETPTTPVLNGANGMKKKLKNRSKTCTIL